MNNKMNKEERVTVEEMRENLLAMMKACFEASAERRDDRIHVRLGSGEEFVVSVMGIL